MKKVQQGFTLIELMIVVAIIGILASVAIPAYQDYIARSQLSEALSLSEGPKTAISEYWGSNGSYPTGNATAGVATTIAGNYVSSVKVLSSPAGVIEATMSSSGVSSGIQGKKLQISPLTTAGSIQWTCKAASTGGIPNKYLPTSCK